MGQKVNPISYRLGYIEGWQSSWMVNKKDWPKNIFQDESIRKYIFTRLPDAGISIINISRTSSQVVLDIKTAKPGFLIGKKGVEVEKIKKELVSLVKQDISINISEVKKPESDARLLARKIGDQLKKRIGTNRAVKQVLGEAMRSGIKGIKIRVSGRLDGDEMARHMEQKDGTVPLHTLRAKIDYESSKVKTIYGIIGIKVWVYHGQIYDRLEIYSEHKKVERSGGNSFTKSKKTSAAPSKFKKPAPKS